MSGDSNVVSKQISEVDQEFGSVATSLAELDKVLSELGNRLDPVLTPEFPKDAAKIGAETPQRQSVIGQRLQTIDGEVKYKTRKVLDILSRLSI